MSNPFDMGFVAEHNGITEDAFASSLANELVGNPGDSAVLEITLAGPGLEVLAEADVALTGADMGMRINSQTVPMWRSIRVGAGDAIEIGRSRRGCRSYLAVNGGFDVPMVMGRRSTYVSGRIGSLKARPLKAGDTLLTGDGPPIILLVEQTIGG